MLSNYCYHNSTGSDWSDCCSDRSIGSHSSPIQVSASVRSDSLDHNYITTPDKWSTIAEYLNCFNPLLAMDSSELFPDLSPYESDDSLANAPTPFMASNLMGDYNDDNWINDIPVTPMPLIDTNNNAINSYNNSIDLNNVLIDFNGLSEVVVESGNEMNAESDATEHQMQYSVTREDMTQLYGRQHESRQLPVVNTRKRHISSYVATTTVVEEDEDEDSEDDYQSSVATRPQTSGKSKSGRKPSKANKCMSKNAIAARENREKKKQYVENMENRLNTLESENKRMKATIVSQKAEIDSLKEEVAFNENIIANDSKLSEIIKHFSKLPNSKIELIGTQFVANNQEIVAKVDNSLPEEKSLRKSSRLAAAKVESTGICVHINADQSMTLRMCNQCSSGTGRKSTKKGK